MYKIYPIKIGEEICDGPLVYHLSSWGEKVNLFDYMWLIKGEGKNILVDTGFIQEHAREFDPGFIQKPEEEPLSRLAKLGVKPDQISHLIVTHTHYDHFSPLIDAYTQAKIFIQKQAVTYLTAPPHPWFNESVMKGMVPKFEKEYRDRAQLVEGDKEILPGIKVFLTGGHSPGLQSVLIQTGKSKVILTSDVAFTYRNIEEDIPVGLHVNIEECYLAMKRIREEADIILPGHAPLILERYGSEIPGKSNFA